MTTPKTKANFCSENVDLRRAWNSPQAIHMSALQTPKTTGKTTKAETGACRAPGTMLKASVAALVTHATAAMTAGCS